MEVFAGVARRHPQSVYAGLHNSLQQEWYCVHSITLVEEILEKSFLPDLFQGDMAKVPTRGITCLTVNQAGLVVPNPNLSAWENWTALYVVTGHLVAALQGRTKFNIGYHALFLQEQQGEIRRHYVHAVGGHGSRPCNGCPSTGTGNQDREPRRERVSPC